VFGLFKRKWLESGMVAAVDGVLREAANGDALQVQKWYFKLKKDAYKQSLVDGVTAEQAERKAFESIEPSKVMAYWGVVQRLSVAGAALYEVNEWLKHNDAV
jgi:hypothetical protein